MERHDDNSLWDLLGQAQKPQIPGNFPDQVLREIRLSGDSQPRRVPIWLRWTFAPLLAGAAALLVVGVRPSDAPGTVPASEISAITETAGQLAVNNLDTAAHLDDLLDHDDENTVWLGTASF